MDPGMSDVKKSGLTHEWVTLQNNHQQYERGALIVKLVAIVMFAIGTTWPHGSTLQGSALFGLLCFVSCMLWAQEAILRTSQARLGERLLRIEALVRNADEDGAGHCALQLHSEWQASRAGSFGLLGEYAHSAIRPTVAFPHLPLAGLLLLFALCH